MITESPFFSVVIPVYNRADSVAATLESVKLQSYTNFECIIVDDGSVDGPVLKSAVEALGDPKFFYIRQENAGGGAARNTGIMAARGSWIALLDSDDGFFPQKLEAIACEIGDHPEVDIWAHRALVERGDGVSFIRPTRLPRENESVSDLMFRHREFLQTSTLTVRADIAKRVLFDPTLRKAQDVDFMIRLERFGARMRCMPDVLSIWNDRPAENRIGGSRRPVDVKRWYLSQKEMMPVEIQRAFEATYLSYEIVESDPIRPAFYIIRAVARRSISLKIAVASLLRVYVPYPLYRKLLNRLVRSTT